MKITEFTINGQNEREATTQEIINLSKYDDIAKKEILKQEIDKAATLQEEIDAIKKFLGV